jgi:hypothetical protein
MAAREHTVSVWLTTEERRVLRKLALLRRTSTSDLMREALRLPPLREAVNDLSHEALPLLGRFNDRMLMSLVPEPRAPEPTLADRRTPGRTRRERATDTLRR